MKQKHQTPSRKPETNKSAKRRLRLRESPRSDYLHPLSPSLGRVMFQWRKRHRLPLSGVAKRAKLSRETVAGMERGTAWYSVCVAARVCDAMGMWFGHAVLLAVRRVGRFPRGKRPVYWQ